MGNGESIVFDDGELDELQRRLASDPSLAPKALEEVQRRSYRVPLAGSEARVDIGGALFEVVNIGSRGIGIAVPREDSFAGGQQLELTLELEGKRLVLRGRVVHLTRETEDCFLCGIRLDLSREEEKELRQIVQQGRSALPAGSRP
ncbi:MAG: PilZ domain-containing protein [Thermodesulfobacteriota bacterium]